MFYVIRTLPPLLCNKKLCNFRLLRTKFFLQYSVFMDLMQMILSYGDKCYYELHRPRLPVVNTDQLNIAASLICGFQGREESNCGLQGCSPAVVDQCSDEICFPIRRAYVSSTFTLQQAWLYCIVLYCIVLFWATYYALTI